MALLFFREIPFIHNYTNSTDLHRAGESFLNEDLINL